MELWCSYMLSHSQSDALCKSKQHGVKDQHWISWSTKADMEYLPPMYGSCMRWRIDPTGV